MGCNRNRLAGSLTAGPLDKKKDEETLFNKAARPCQAAISPQGLPEMRERESRDQQGGMEVWGGQRKRGKRVIARRKRPRETERGGEGFCDRVRRQREEVLELQL